MSTKTIVGDSSPADGLSPTEEFHTLSSQGLRHTRFAADSQWGSVSRTRLCTPQALHHTYYLSFHEVPSVIFLPPTAYSSDFQWRTWFSMAYRRFFRFVFIAWVALIGCHNGLATAATVSGDLVKWHPITLDFDGPSSSETAASPNPFMDYRLDVVFTAPSGATTRVPGFFDGDGQGNGSGNVWRARFSANEVGEWHYSASLRQGTNVAVSLNQDAGQPVDLPGANGQFTVSERYAAAPGFLSQGRLNYVNNHYLKFDDGPYWIKGGTDSPENLLGFEGIDGTVSQGGINPSFLHDYAQHIQDWNSEDPLFENSQNGKDGRGLIGAMNYLASVGVNSVYFLPMNLGGDGQDSYPFVGAGRNTFDKTHYDISKLHQWTTVFDHAQQKGLFLHFVLTETEPDNERWLDNGAMGNERKLFFRELVARFGYLLAAKWNLGEENDFPVSELRLQASYLNAIDWSKKPVTVHTQINDFRDYVQIVGDPLFTATSIQYDWEFAGEFVERWRKESTDAGVPWVLDMDENTGGVSPTNAAIRRKQILYDVYFSGGQIEWYFGYHPLPLGGDVTAGDFRLREAIWQYTTYARQFMENELPFWLMAPADDLISGEHGLYGGAEVFAKAGDVYAIYLPQASQNATLDLRAVSGSFSLRWYNPRTGNFEGSSTGLNGGSLQSLGSPPSNNNDDWVALVKRDGYTFAVPGPETTSTVEPVPAPIAAPVVIPTPEPEPEPAPVSAPTPEPTLETTSPAEPPVSDEPSATPIPTSALPSFLPFTAPEAIPGTTISFSVVAIDEDGVAPVVTVEEDLPQSVQMAGLGGGELRFIWDIPSDQTEPFSLVVVARDAITEGSEISTTISVPVTAIVTHTPVPSPAPAPSPSPEPAPPPESTPTPSPVDPSRENHLPLLVSLNDRTVMVGERLAIPVVAVDPDGFVPAVWSNDLPAGAALDDAGNGTRTLNWIPTPDQLGEHVITIEVQDAVESSVKLTNQWRLTVIDQTVNTAPLFSQPGASVVTNNPPIFKAIPKQTIVLGETMRLEVKPIDPEGIAPHLQLSTVLPGAQFDDLGNGGRELRWTPMESNLGVTTLEFVATDSLNSEISSSLSVEVEVIVQ